MLSSSIYNLSTTYFETHMMKNVEWGAIAYLQQAATADANLSKHNIMEINKSQGNGEYVAAYNELLGGTVNYNVILNGNSLKQAADKFKDIVILKDASDDSSNYKDYKNYYGNAIGETSTSGSGNTSLNSETSVIPNTSSPFVVRTGRFGYTSGSGLPSTVIGFRPTLTVKATPTISKYNVSVLYDGTIGSVSGINSYTSGSTVTLTATSTENNIFERWEVVSGGITIASSTSSTISFTMPSKNVVLHAKFISQGVRVN